jgi:hypothetical protein
MLRHRWSIASFGSLAGACVVAGLLSSAAASRPGLAASLTPTKRCHYVVKKGQGKKKHVRVCKEVQPRRTRADLGLTLAVAPNPIVAGSLLVISATVHNKGPGRATYVTLRVKPSFDPSFIGYEDAEFIGGANTCFQALDEIDCTRLNVLRVGASAVVSLPAVPPLPGDAPVAASVSADQRDPTAADERATAVLHVTGTCDPSYPSVCIPPPPPLTSDDIFFINFTVIYAVANPDPHHFDADHDGVGCE